MPDQNPLDVEAIRARLDATSPGMRVDVHVGGSTLRATADTKNPHRIVTGISDLVSTFTGGDVGPVTATFVDDEDGQDATFALNAANDIRSLLDENARLNAENDDMRKRVAFAAAVISGDAAEMLAESLATVRTELDRVIREAAADKARVAAVEKAVRDSWPWRCDSPTHNTICHLRALTPVNIALGYGSEMPRPPAEEAPTHFAPYGHAATSCGETIPKRMPWNFAAADWDSPAITTRRAMATCVLCLAVFRNASESANGTAQPGASGPETPGTGSGRGTGVAEAPETAQEGDDWFTDVAEAVRPAHYRQAAGELLALVAHFEHIGSERTEWMAGLRDGAEHLARSTSDPGPSLPVPSTEEARDA